MLTSVMRVNRYCLWSRAPPKTKAQISLGCFVLALEGVPRLVSLKAVTTQGDAVTAAPGSIPMPSANHKLSRLDRLIQGFAYPS